ncbi:MAG: right-handed parallel beta-helix repeat-containing protein [Phycisphaerales bacterium]|nr:MAG: right-handed parallel beta-helix repeat-containing protein [Phycisphaerales bacterium]
MQNDDVFDRRVLLAGLGAAGAFAATRSLRAGDLNPPAGPISPTMKTLDEIEPRTAINAQNTPGDTDCLYRISQPGSYYVTENLHGESGKSGICIDSENVKVDLMGFSIVGAPGSLYGVFVRSFRRSIRLHNGSVEQWGLDGVNLVDGDLSGVNHEVDAVFVSQNNGRGIRVGANSVIQNCIAFNNGTIGISGGVNAIISHCVARTSGNVGIAGGAGGTMMHCAAEQNASHGLFTSNSGLVLHCNSLNNEGNGIHVGVASMVSHCTAAGNTISGIRLNGRSIALNNVCQSNNAVGDGAGILISNARNRVEGNNCVLNGVGIRATTGGHFIARNTCSGNVVNWDIAANNACLVVNATLGSAFAGNAGGVSTGSTDPNANYTY